MDIKKKKMQNLLEIDNIDRLIMKRIWENPEITHSQIAKEVNLSQPAIGARILKLKRKNLLVKQVGLNIKELGIYTAIVLASVRNVKTNIKIFEDCPYISYIFRISGEYNIFCFLIALDLKVIDKIINTYFRKNPDVLKVNFSVITQAIEDMVFPIDFNIGNLSYNYKD